MRTEPARMISIVTAFATALIGLLVAFGFDVTDQQRTAVLAMIGATVPLIVLGGEAIRSQVVPLSKVERLAFGARETGSDTNDVNERSRSPHTIDHLG